MNLVLLVIFVVSFVVAASMGIAVIMSLRNANIMIPPSCENKGSNSSGDDTMKYITLPGSASAVLEMDEEAWECRESILKRNNGLLISIGVSTGIAFLSMVGLIGKNWKVLTRM